VIKGGYEGGTKIRVLVEDRWGTDGVVREDFAKDVEYTKIVLPGVDNSLRTGRASNLYYYRVTIFDAETDVQLATATVYTPYY